MNGYIVCEGEGRIGFNLSLSLMRRLFLVYFCLMLLLCTTQIYELLSSLFMFCKNSVLRLTNVIIRVGFLVCWKMRQNLAPLATPGLLCDYRAVTSMLSKKKKNVFVVKTIFKVLFQEIIFPLRFHF